VEANVSVASAYAGAWRCFAGSGRVAPPRTEPEVSAQRRLYRTIGVLVTEGGSDGVVSHSAPRVEKEAGAGVSGMGSGKHHDVA
jgi:hypothetical protein